MENEKWKIFLCLTLTSNLSELGQTGMSVLLKMLDECGFGHVNRQLADVGHVVADAFQMFAYEKQARVTGGSGWFSDHHLDQLMKDVVISVVDFRVAFDDLARRRGIARGESI